jgi:hypothetical protein
VRELQFLIAGRANMGGLPHYEEGTEDQLSPQLLDLNWKFKVFEPSFPTLRNKHFFIIEA